MYYELLSRPPSRFPRRATFDIAIPVFDALEEVQRCLQSVIATRTAATRILILDDGSSRETQGWLRQFTNRYEEVCLLRHPKTEGYTRSANDLLAASAADYVVLLNSDTVVPHGWLDRIAAVAERHPDVGLLGPLSNAASWQSVPNLFDAAREGGLAVNRMPSSWSVDDLDFIVAALAPQIYPRVPLLNGFCYVVTRQAIETVGYFDEHAFPQGYGEEDDYTFRAADAGLGAMVVTDLYLYHAKSRTFGADQRTALKAGAKEALRRKWGRRRVVDGIRTMRENPLLAEKRELIAIAMGNVPVKPPRLSVPDAAEYDGLASRLSAEGISVEREKGSRGAAHAPTDTRPRDGHVSLLRTGAKLELRAGLEDEAIAWLSFVSQQTQSSEGHGLPIGGSPDEWARRLGALIRLLAVTLTEDGLVVRDGNATRPASRFSRLDEVGQRGEEPDEPSFDPFLTAFDADLTEILASARITDAFKRSPRADLTRIAWFVPRFDHALRGGVRTILALATHLSERVGTENLFVVCDHSRVNLTDIASEVSKHFPSLRAQFFNHQFGEDLSRLPPAPTAICTLWTTAYALLRYNKCDAKFYLVQDWEPGLYVAGNRSGRIQETYRFGFIMIANTPGVAQHCLLFDDWVGVFRPGVDRSVFFPSQSRDPGPPYRVVFYGRPARERNCFLLGAEALWRLKRECGDAVEVVSVGANYDPQAFGLDGVLRNLGVLRTLEEVAELYRRSHVGLVFMTTAHPSYQPLEYMASGCVTVTNANPWNGWLLSDRENCVLAPMTPSSVAHTLRAVLEDGALREGVGEGGLRTAAELDWQRAFSDIVTFLQSPEPLRSASNFGAEPNRLVVSELPAAATTSRLAP